MKCRQWGNVHDLGLLSAGFYSTQPTQHTLALLRNKQDAAPRQRHSKTRPLGLDNATASKTQLLDNATGFPRRFL